MDIAKYTEECKLQGLFDDLVIKLVNRGHVSDKTIRTPLGNTWVRISYTRPDGLMFAINPEDRLMSRIRSTGVSFAFIPNDSCLEKGNTWAMDPRYFGQSKDNCDILLYDYIAAEMYRNGKGFVFFTGDTEGTVGRIESKTPEVYPKTLSSFTKNAFTYGNENVFVEHLACMSIAMRRLIFKTGLYTKDKFDISDYAKRRAEERRHARTDLGRMRTSGRVSLTRY